MLKISKNLANLTVKVLKYLEILNDWNIQQLIMNQQKIFLITHSFQNIRMNIILQTMIMMKDFADIYFKLSYVIQKVQTNLQSFIESKTHYSIKYQIVKKSMTFLNEILKNYKLNPKQKYEKLRIYNLYYIIYIQRFQLNQRQNYDSTKIGKIHCINEYKISQSQIHDFTKQNFDDEPIFSLNKLYYNDNENDLQKSNQFNDKNNQKSKNNVISSNQNIQVDETYNADDKNDKSQNDEYNNNETNKSENIENNNSLNLLQYNEDNENSIHYNQNSNSKKISENDQTNVSFKLSKELLQEDVLNQNNLNQMHQQYLLSNSYKQDLEKSLRSSKSGSSVFAVGIQQAKAISKFRENLLESINNSIDENKAKKSTESIGSSKNSNKKKRSLSDDNKQDQKMSIESRITKLETIHEEKENCETSNIKIWNNQEHYSPYSPDQINNLNDIDSNHNRKLFSKLTQRSKVNEEKEISQKKTKPKIKWLSNYKENNHTKPTKSQVKMCLTEDDRLDYKKQLSKEDNLNIGCKLQRQQNISRNIRSMLDNK